MTVDNASPRRLTAWVLTDGKAGDEMQCLGVVEAMGLEPEIRRVSPRPPFVWAMPRGPIDPREGPDRPGSPIAPPWPDLLVASGRRAVPYVRAVKRLSGGRTFTVILKDPRTGTGTADLIWVQAHDRLRGANVLATVTAPHRVHLARLNAARENPDPRYARVPHPRVAVLVGGDSRHHRFTNQDIADFSDKLLRLAMSGVGLIATVSRRTPTGLRAAVEGIVTAAGGFLWDGTGDNPYPALLADVDAVVATADSTNMVGEAAVTGRPVLLFAPSGGHPKIGAYLDALRAQGIVHVFKGHLEGEPYPPLNSTPVIAAAVHERLAAHQDNLSRAGA